MATTLVELEKRVRALEEELRQLKATLAAGTPKPDNTTPQWWLANAGAFAGDPAFAEVVRLGREYRDAQRPGRTKAAGRKRGKPAHADP